MKGYFEYSLLKMTLICVMRLQIHNGERSFHIILYIIDSHILYLMLLVNLL